VDILNPKEGDTRTINGVTFRVKSVVQDSVEIEIIEGNPTPEELEAVMHVHANDCFNAQPRVQLQMLQQQHGRKSNES
jgi:hypothetical protein